MLVVATEAEARRQPLIYRKPVEDGPDYTHLRCLQEAGSLDGSANNAVR